MTKLFRPSLIAVRLGGFVIPARLIKDKLVELVHPFFKGTYNINEFNRCIL